MALPLLLALLGAIDTVEGTLEMAMEAPEGTREIPADAGDGTLETALEVAAEDDEPPPTMRPGG